VAAFLEEMAAFPKGKNDDQVDMLSQMLDRWRTSFGKSQRKVMQPPPRRAVTGVDM
jgi:phage terminase large subunit-like protein